jgi:hypothetical protein
MPRRSHIRAKRPLAVPFIALISLSHNSTCRWPAKPDALLRRTDRGGQYTSEQFPRLMADHMAEERHVTQPL